MSGLLLGLMWLPAEVRAKDYFLTIGGGYNPEGNQASLEANVLFFRDVLREQHPGPLTHEIFFADGTDKEADLQVANTGKSNAPATDLLQSLFRYRGGRLGVFYRNHRIPDIAGPNDPTRVRESLNRIASDLQAGDRLFVYVTAHGRAGGGRNPYNTTISCWDGESISARQLASWLEEVPPTVPTIMVMAQCYCGGFAHVMFENASQRQGLSDRIRVGFFAQQHDLAAAGCRPDIENDEEYSSYFWGALAGRSRTGKPVGQVDIDGDGYKSLSEAHAYAVLNSNTIDIPLSSSESLLRVYSRIADYEHRREVAADEADRNSGDTTQVGPQLSGMQGTLSELAQTARVELRVVIEGLATQLEFASERPVTDVFQRFEQVKRENREAARGSGRGRRGRSSYRRQLREEIEDTWPELADREQWRQSELLSPENQLRLLAEIEDLPSFSDFDQARQDRAAELERSQLAELREIKFQRLINALEQCVLAQNLPLVADAAVVKRYNEMLRVEAAPLSPAAVP